MKKLLFFCCGLVLISNYGSAQIRLEIEINEIRNNHGNIMLQIFDENEKVIAQEMSPIKDNKSLFIIKNIKPGKIAIRYFHDENKNGEMEVNNMGIPTEGYGFSNNAQEMFGPPLFEKWLFEVKENKKIVLKINY